MNRFALTLVLALALAGCTTLGLPSPKSPAQTVFELKASEGAALAVAIQYKALPSCAAAVHPAVCSDAAIVKKIADADVVASASIDAAEKAVRTPGFGADTTTSLVTAANQAVLALTVITSSLKVK